VVRLEVLDDGTIRFVNDEEKEVLLWNIEFTYLADIEREHDRQDRKRVRRRITERIDVKEPVRPGYSKSFSTGLPRESIVEVKAFYEKGGRFKKIVYRNAQSRSPIG